MSAPESSRPTVHSLGETNEHILKSMHKCYLSDDFKHDRKQSNLYHDEHSLHEKMPTKWPPILILSTCNVSDLPERTSTDTNDIGNDHLFQSDYSDDDSNDKKISTDSIPEDIVEIHVSDIHIDEEPKTNIIYPIPDDSTIRCTNTITSDYQRVTQRCGSSTRVDGLMRFGT